MPAWALPLLGRYRDAFISVGLGLLNAVISAAQEIRARRKLDRLRLLDRAPVLVVRDGREAEVAPETVVRGDVLRVGLDAGEPVSGLDLGGLGDASLDRTVARTTSCSWTTPSPR